VWVLPHRCGFYNRLISHYSTHAIP
jgi:hypothetical protein